mgnify:CR=1 FL=1
MENTTKNKQLIYYKLREKGCYVDYSAMPKAINNLRKTKPKAVNKLNKIDNTHKNLSLSVRKTNKRVN